MFKRYWREYPWFLQVTLFGLMAFTMVSFAGFVLYTLMPIATGYGIDKILGIDENSSAKLKSAFLWTQALSSVFTFLIPPVLFAYLTTPRVKEYLGLKVPAQPLHLLLGVLVMLGSMPVFIEIAASLKDIVPGTGEEKVEKVTKALLDIKTSGQLVQVLLVMALIPAIGEELFFRGVLLRFAHQRMGRIVLPIIITSVLFSIVHNSIYNFLSIAMAGSLLCLIYYWSGSLLTSIVTHFVYNGAQIYLSYASRNSEAMQQIADAKHLPVSYVIGGLVVFTVSLYALWKTRKPLSPYWSANFSKEELAQQQTDV